MAVITGDETDNTLVGTTGADQISGLAGNDTLQGGADADALDGGDGIDTASYAGSTAGVSVNLATGAGTGGDAQGDTLTGIENLTGSDNNDTLIGDAGANVLDGGAGNDTLVGGGGADQLIGGDGVDTASYATSASGVNVSLDINYGLSGGGDAEGDTLSGIENLIGSAFNDGLIGDAGNNRLEGGAGDDTLIGGAGADELIGGDGTRDTATYSLSATGVTVNLTTNVNTGGDAAGDTLSGIENVFGSAFDDTLTGDGNVNAFMGGAGADTIDGGANNDTAQYTTSASAVTVNLTTNVNTGGDAAGDFLYNIENLVGSFNNDSLTGSTAANRLEGNLGNDTLAGLGGADTLIGGDGIDTADYSASASAVTVNLATNVNTGGDAQGDTLTTIENLIGSGNNDSLTGNAGANRLEGGLGNDTLTGGAGADELFGGDGSDTVSYAGSTGGVTVNLAASTATGGDAAGDTLNGIENITGSGQADTLTGDGNANVLDGGNGNDTLNGGAGADTISGGTGGADTASYAQSSAGVTVNLTTNVNTGGDAEGDVLDTIENLFGSAFDDSLTGDGNANAFTGGAGADTMDGDGGTDTAQYTTSASAVTVNLATNINTGGDAQGDSLSDIENLIGSNFDDSLTGDSANNTLNGGNGNGNDTLTGGAGNDTLIGGAGTDTAVYALAGSNYALSYNGTAVTVTATSGTDGTDTLTGIEKLQFSDGTLTIAGNGTGLSITGDAGNNTINGTAGTDIILGGDGNDTINGLGGDDVIDGGNGNDTINGGAGADIIIGSAGYDNITGGSEIDVLDYSALPVTSPWNGIYIALHAGEVLYYRAGQMVTKDTVAGVEHFIASAGNDWIYGTGGDEIFEGGAGADIFDGNGGNDTMSYVHSSAGVTVNLTTGQASGGDAQGDIFSGGYADPVYGPAYGMTADGPNNLWGSAFADTLTGNIYANLLRGNDGDDILEGGRGNDTLEGGAGIDSARFANFIDAYTISYSNGVITVTANAGGTEGTDTLTGIEKLVFGGVTFDFTGWTGGALPEPIGTILGTEGDDNLVDTSGNDVILAYGGNDVIHITGGNDAILGGGGTDRLDYTGYTVSSGWGGLRFNAAQNTVETYQNEGWVVKDRYSGIEILTGTSQADWFAGSNSVDEVFEGGAGADVFDGGGGGDTLSYEHSSAGVNVNFTTGTASGGDAEGDIIGGSYNAPGSNAYHTIAPGMMHLWGSAYADTLTGNSDGQLLRGNAGNDLLTGKGGADTLDGGAGIDTASYAGSAGVTVSLATNTGLGGDAQGDTLIDIENLTGSGNNDTLIGDGIANVLDGGDGDDLLTGGAGNDTLIGGNGTDTAVYALASGSYTITNAAGVVTVTALSGNEGTDTLIGFEYLQFAGVNYSLTVLNGAVFPGSSGNDTIVGTSGNDTILASLGNDSINGGGGFDTLRYDGLALPGPWTGIYFAMHAGATYYLRDGAMQVKDTIPVTGSVESFIGTAGRDWIYGLSGDEVFEGGAGADIFDGNGGNDTMSYVHSSAGVNVNLTTGVATGGDAEGDIFSGNYADVVYGPGYIMGADGPANLWGSAYADTLTGIASSVNNLKGNGGNDTIIGVGAGDRAIFNGNSTDYLITRSNGLTTVQDLNLADGDDGTDTVAGIRTLVFADGTVDFDPYNATAGNDVITGSYLNDTIVAMEGNDVINTGLGTDSVDGGAGFDTLTYANTTLPGAWTGVYFALHDNTGRVYYLRDGAMQLKDTLTYGSVESFIGTAGRDWIYGLTGDEVFEGGAGADIFDGNGGNDTMSYVHSSAGVNVNLTTGVATGGDAQGDIFSGSYADPVYGPGYTMTADGPANLWGSAYADTLTGNSGLVNKLKGNGGNDTLAGIGTGDIAVYSGNSTDYLITTNNGVVTVQDLNLNDGDDGTDTVTGIRLFAFADTTIDLDNSSTNDIITGSSGNDTINAGGGNDIINPGAGNDTVNGGSGFDTVDYTTFTPVSPYANGLMLSRDAAYYFVSGGTAQIKDALSGIESVIGTQYDDWYFNTGVEDVFEGGAGADIFDGQGGNDTISYVHSSAAVTINLGSGLASGGDAQGDIFLGYYTDPWEHNGRYADGANNVWGSAYGDTLTGSAGANEIKGNGGNDTLTGGDGSDTYLVGRGDGMDTIVQAGITDAVGTSDIVKFTAGVAYNQLWFSQQGDDLRINVIGETNNGVLLEDWYIDSTRRVDAIYTTDGSHTLSAANIQALVDAMASYSPPAAGQFTLDPQVANDLAPVFATAWA